MNTLLAGWPISNCAWDRLLRRSYRSRRPFEALIIESTVLSHTTLVPNENSVRSTSRAISRDEPQRRGSLRPSLSLPNEIRCGAGVQGSTVRTVISDSRRGSVQPGRLWLFRPPVVRSGDATHRPAVTPRRTPFPAAESLVAPASPSPAIDVFSIGDNNRNTN